MQKPTPPRTQSHLLQRANALEGHTLGYLSQKLNIPLPINIRSTKGFVGQLLEYALGANAQNLPQPDFQLLGIELKTLPLDHKGDPKGSTFVCSIPNKLNGLQTQWKTSWVSQKLNRVLWIPIEADPKIPFADRQIKKPFLWFLSEHPALLTCLKKDFEELIEMLILGDGSLNAHFGKFLQVRPKAAHSRVTHQHINLEGEILPTVPKGFYLRSCFTKTILRSMRQQQPVK